MKNLLRRQVSLALKAWNDPKTAVRVGKALLRGTWYIARYSLFSKRIKISFPFKAYAPVTLKGPGTISIGKGCSVYWNVFDGLTVVTLAKEARVSIGERCGLGGLTIRCSTSVTLGNNCLAANSLIQDGFMVNQGQEGYEAIGNKIPVPQPIALGNNVWLCGQSGVVRGSRIGDDCVLSRGSMTFGSEIGKFQLAMGSPSGATMPIERLLALKGIL